MTIPPSRHSFPPSSPASRRVEAKARAQGIVALMVVVAFMVAVPFTLPGTPQPRADRAHAGSATQPEADEEEVIDVSRLPRIDASTTELPPAHRRRTGSDARPPARR